MKEQFYTRDKASKGVKFYLTDMATGKLTDEYLLVRSRWCDEFQEAKELAVQQAFKDAAIENEEEKKAAHKKRKLALIASLIGGWSFDEECKTEDVMEFLAEAVHIPDKVDKLATEDHRFFGKTSKG